MNHRDLTLLLQQEHKKHRSYGYHRLAAVIKNNTGWAFSDHLAHVCAKTAGIRSAAKHYHYLKTGEESIIYPNQIQGWWNASEPLEIVVSEMTELTNQGTKNGWAYVLATLQN